jgi:hypothetical protein
MGVSVLASGNSATIRVPTDRGGVGTVMSQQKVDPDRGFRPYTAQENKNS